MKDIMQKLAELEATAPKVTKKKMLNEDSTTPPMNVSNKPASLKDMFEMLSENVAPGQKPLPVLDPQKKQAGMGFVTSDNPAVQNMLKNLDPKDVQIVQAPGQPGQAPAAGQPNPNQLPTSQQAMQEVDMGQAEKGMRKSTPHTGGYNVVDKAGKVISTHKGQRDAMQAALKNDDYSVKAIKEKKLDELSPQTLGSYVKQASAELPGMVAKSGSLHRAKKDTKLLNRQRGIERAVDKMTNEGAKVDRMVKHIEKSEKKLGKSKGEAEDIAWATANKRGMLDNKNKKKVKESTSVNDKAYQQGKEAKERGYERNSPYKKLVAEKYWLAGYDGKPKPKAVKEADIAPTNGIDTRGAGLGAGRSMTTLEGKKKVAETSSDNVSSALSIVNTQIEELMQLAKEKPLSPSLKRSLTALKQIRAVLLKNNSVREGKKKGYDAEWAAADAENDLESFLSGGHDVPKKYRRPRSDKNKGAGRSATTLEGKKKGYDEDSDLAELYEAELPKDPLARQLASLFDRGDFKSIDRITNSMAKSNKDWQKNKDAEDAKARVNRMRAARGLPLKEDEDLQESKSISAAAKKSEAQRQSLIKKAARELNFKTKPTTAEELVKKYDLFASDAAEITKMAKELSKVQEGKKPDFLDLDKDGNKKESMKKAAADKKKKVKEAFDTGRNWQSISQQILSKIGTGPASWNDIYSFEDFIASNCDKNTVNAYHGLSINDQDSVYRSIGNKLNMKKTVKESAMNHRISAARLEGKSHGLRGHAHSGKRYEDLDEVRAYHEGYKEGLDECYGQGVYETAPAMPATVPGMASAAMPTMEDDMEEGNAFTAALAKTPKGGKFSVGGKTFTDRTSYDANLGEYAFESLDNQLNALLTESEEVNEGLSVSISKGQENSPDSVTITAQDAEAEHLLAFVKNAGLGLFGDDNVDTHSSAMSVQPAAGDPDEVGAGGVDIGVVDGHDGMMGLMQKLSGVEASGAEDYADEEGDEEQLYGNHEEAHEETCNECGSMMEAGHSCGSKEMVDEVETEDQEEFEVAEDNAPDSDEAETSADEDAEAKEDSALAGAMSKDEEEIDEGFTFESIYKKFDALAESKESDDEDEDEDEDDDSHKSLGAAGKAKKSFGKEKIDEWANEAGKKGTDAAFEADIDFMTKVIAGGLNKPKSTGQTTVPVIAGQESRMHDHQGTVSDSIDDWTTLAGIK
jgi:hypothetical protein